MKISIIKKVLLLALVICAITLTGCKGSGKICGQKVDITVPSKSFSVDDQCEINILLEENVADLSAVSELVLTCDDFVFDSEHVGAVRMSGFEWDKEKEISFELKCQGFSPTSGEISVMLISDWSGVGQRDSISQTTVTRIYYFSDGDNVALSRVSCDDAEKKIK